jgi:outer membrane protein assembly factor BamC
MSKVYFVLCLVFVSTLSACSFFSKDKSGPFKNYSKDYLKSDTIPVISVPDDMVAPRYVDLYPVKDAAGTDEFGDPVALAEYEIPRPQSINSVDESFSIKIQRLDAQRWLALNAPTSQVWPQVQNFLNVAGLPVVSSMASSGLIETDWLKFNDDENHKVRFRIRLEKGIHPDSTEIHLLQMQVPIDQEDTSEVNWPKVSQDAEKEQWMLQKLAENLADSLNNASASLLGQYVGGDLKAGFVKGAAEPTMVLRLSPDRAWASLLGAAQKDGYVLWDRDAVKGVIYVGFDRSVAENKGFWSKTLSFGRDNVPEKARHGVSEMLKHLSGSSATRSAFEGIDGVAFESALSRADEGFLIVMKPREDHYSVIIRDQRGRQLSREDAKNLMRLLRKNLS